MEIILDSESSNKLFFKWNLLKKSSVYIRKIDW